MNVQTKLLPTQSSHKVSQKYFLCLFQFEGGLFLTAAVVDGAYQLASKLGKAPTINIVNIFLPISFNMCFVCSKEPSH